MPKKRRVMLSDVRVDVENAFGNWKDLLPSQYVSGVKDCQDAEARVNAFLDQVEQERELLCDALEVCQAIVEAETGDLAPTKAKRLAAEVIAKAKRNT